MMQGSTVGVLLRDGKAALLDHRHPAVAVLPMLGKRPEGASRKQA